MFDGRFINQHTYLRVATSLFAGIVITHFCALLTGSGLLSPSVKLIVFAPTAILLFGDNCQSLLSAKNIIGDLLANQG